MKSWVIFAIIGAAVAAVGFGYVQFTGGVPVQSASVRVGAIRELVDEQAKTRLPKVHLITMPFTGRIESIELAEGTAVKKGQTVARIVPRDMKLVWNQAKSAVERLDASIRENDDVSVESTSLKQAVNFVLSMDSTVAAARERVRAGSAKLDYAKSHLDRTLKLRPSNAKTLDDEEQARLGKVQSEIDYQQDKLVLSAVEAMQAATALMPTAVRQYIERKALTREVLSKQKAEAQAQLERVEVDEQRSTMTSPVDGVILERIESNERYLPAGTELLKIGDLSQLEVEAEILSQDVVRIKPEAAAEVYGPAIGVTPAKATVARIFPGGFTKISSLGVEQQRVKVILRFEPDELARLRQYQNLGVDFRVRVRVFTANSENTLVVPRSALFRGPDGAWQVFAVRNRRAELQTVKVGLMNDEAAEIAEGLAEGETVVLSPETSLTPGTRVAVNE
jgi:HlyD family secretion protein